MKNAFFIIVFLFFYCPAKGQSAHSFNKKGDAFYDKSEFKKAEEQYQKALELNPKETRSQYNSANSAYEQGNYMQALDLYKSTVESTENATERAAAWHNIGNAHYEQKQFEEAEKAFKNSLRYNAGDFETKKNLALAQKQLKQQQDEQKKQQQNEQKNNPKPEQEPGDQPENQPENDSKMSKKEAQDLLKILNEEEKKAQKKPKNDGQRGKIQRKDW